MKKLWIAALLSIFCAPAIALAQTEQEAKERSASEAAAGDSEKPQGPGSEHHPESEEGDPTRHFNFIGGPFDHLGKDEYGGKFGDDVMTRKDGTVVTNEKGEKEEEEPMSPPFIFMLINFGLFLIILAKYLAPAGTKVAQERHDMIKTALDEAAKLREQAQKKLSEYEARIKNVDAEVKTIIDDIRATADADKKRILENAERQAAQMKRDAELRIAAEIDMARAQLSREVATAAATATEKLLREKTTSDDQKKLVGNFISGMGA